MLAVRGKGSPNVNSVKKRNVPVLTVQGRGMPQCKEDDRSVVRNARISDQP
jgi:hypothetical protein